MTHEQFIERRNGLQKQHDAVKEDLKERIAKSLLSARNIYQSELVNIAPIGSIVRTSKRGYGGKVESIDYIQNSIDISSSVSYKCLKHTETPYVQSLGYAVVFVNDNPRYPAEVYNPDSKQWELINPHFKE